MVHQSSDAPPSRRDRTRRARRRAFLEAARALVEREGIEALTIKALADELDCAVGSLYTYFGSKDALLAAMQADAIERLGDVWEHVLNGLEPMLADLDEPVAAVARVLAFGRAVILAEGRFPQELHLQQQMLMVSGVDPDEVARVVPVAFAVLGQLTDLLDRAARAGAIEPAAGEGLDRTVTLVSALNGVLMVSRVSSPDAGLFDGALLADRLLLDLLAGWGAEHTTLQAASDHCSLEAIDHLLSTVPPEDSTS